MTAKHSAGVSSFSVGKRQLHVFYANRNDIEKTCGVDLVYYNAFFQSFVLVQYKLMGSEPGGFVYRPDSQFEIELARMEDFLKKSATDQGIQDHRDERLNTTGFFVKFVPDQGIPCNGELVKGMYVTHEYARFLVGPAGPKGKKGGRMLSFQNVQRYFSNSDFAALVRSAWIGTRGSRTDDLQAIIRGSYETDHALYVAYEQERPDT
jgi:hypothetical protein